MIGVSDIRYAPETHQYFLGTQELISVTRAIREGGLDDERATAHYSEASRTRGANIHDAIAEYCGHDPAETRRCPPQAWCRLDEEESLQGYWGGFVKFLDSSGFRAEQVEQIVHDDVRGYAGRYDLLGTFPGIADWPGMRTLDLIDVKTGSVPRTVGPQTMAYRRCLTFPAIRRWALNLSAAGTWRLVPLNMYPAGRIDRLKDRYDETIFLAALQIAQWKRMMR